MFMHSKSRMSFCSKESWKSSKRTMTHSSFRGYRKHLINFTNIFLYAQAYHLWLKFDIKRIYMSNPSTKAEFDTRKNFFKKSLKYLNSKFFLTKKNCHKESSLSYYLSMSREIIVECIPLTDVLDFWERQITTSRIWTHINFLSTITIAIHSIHKW